MTAAARKFEPYDEPQERTVELGGRTLQTLSHGQKVWALGQDDNGRIGIARSSEETQPEMFVAPQFLS